MWKKYKQPTREDVTGLEDAGVQILAVTEVASPEEGTPTVAHHPSVPRHADLSWLDSPSSTWVERAAREALHNYASVYIAYLLVIVGLGSLVLSIGSELSVSQSVFTAFSAVTQSGLAVADFADASMLTHVVVFVLIILGSPVLLTLAPVMLRRFAFHSLKRWCQNTGRQAPNSDEDGALKILCRIVLGFWFCTELLGFLLLLNVDFSRHNGKPTAWNALFMTTSAFQNTGLALTPSSLEPVNQNPFVLYVMSLLIILGNTAVPICLRVIAVLVFRWTRAGSSRREHLAFLLKEPRRCYTHLFSPLNTLWLAFMLVALLLFQIFIIAWLDWNSPELAQFTDPQVRFANVFFQAASTRTAGLNSVTLQNLSLVTNFVIMVCMYISTSPIVVTMRATNVKYEQVDSNNTDSVRSQALTYFTQHGAILVVLHLAIMLLESEKMASRSEPCDSMVSCDLRARFSFFKVMFEIVSAYGTVGLSLGSTYVKNSFCEDWSVPSQLLLCGVMVLGRTRDLPLSIDHAFKMHWDRADHAEFFMKAVESWEKMSAKATTFQWMSEAKLHTWKEYFSMLHNSSSREDDNVKHCATAPLMQGHSDELDEDLIRQASM